MRRPIAIAVIGAGDCSEAVAERAHEVGRRLAEAGCVVVTGGLGGVMQGASRGAAEAGGRVVGILPGADPAEANPWVECAIATGTGDARNAMIANTAEGFIAIDGSYGTLSEIAFAKKRGKPVICLDSWTVTADSMAADPPTGEAATDPADAVRRMLAALGA